MMKNITSAIPGVLFDLAIKSVEPLLGDSIQQFQSIANFINNRNINSCKAAKSLISAAGTELGMSTQSTCQTIATSIGIASDETDAEMRCQSNSGVSDIMNRANADPSAATMKPFAGNLVWASLKRLNHLDDDERALIMSITGTTVYPEATDNASEPQSFPPTITDPNQLLIGDASAGSGNLIALNLLNCGGDLTNCLIAPGNSTTTSAMQSLTDRVGTLMRAISTKISTRTALVAAETNFVNNVPMPVYRMIAASNTINNSAISDSVINAFQEYVAIEYARALLSRLAQEGVNAGGLTSQLSPLQREQLKNHVDNARALLTRLDSRALEASHKAQAFTSVAAHIENLQRTLRASLPQQVADLLAFSNAGVGR
jgi:conjugative transfer pilus assembly protein TraH